MGSLSLTSNVKGYIPIFTSYYILKMMSKALLATVLAGAAAAETVQTYTQYQPANMAPNADPRTGFGANANIGYANGNGLGFDGGVQTPFGGVNADFGLRAPSFANNNLLTGLIIFLGVLSFINIVATVVTPWLAGLGGGGDERIEKNVEKGRRYQRNINMLADYALNSIEAF